MFGFDYPARVRIATVFDVGALLVMVAAAVSMWRARQPGRAPAGSRAG
jgi:hypothetical protein